MNSIPTTDLLALFRASVRLDDLICLKEKLGGLIRSGIAIASCKKERFP